MRRMSILDVPPLRTSGPGRGATYSRILRLRAGNLLLRPRTANQSQIAAPGIKLGDERVKVEFRILYILINDDSKRLESLFGNSLHAHEQFLIDYAVRQTG